MNLDQLIQEGEQVKETCSEQGMTSVFLTGEPYEIWISKCILYLERSRVSKTLEERFKEAAARAVGNSISYYNTMMGVLRALKDFE